MYSIPLRRTVNTRKKMVSCQYTMYREIKLLEYNSTIMPKLGINIAEKAVIIQ